MTQIFILWYILKSADICFCLSDKDGNLQFLNNVIIIKAKVIPQAYVILANTLYPFG
jgi:hypothetical protein